MKPNGHDKSTSGANGHALPSPSREVRVAHLEPGGAAFDDRRDFPAAAGASAPAGMERERCAELAPPGSGNSRRGRNSRNHDRATQANASDSGDEVHLVDIPPGCEPLPVDGPGFVDAMHAHVDLYLACARLVKSSDEKIAQRMVERLLEMSYGKSPAQSGEDVTPIIFDAPRPRD